jgi:hypothetical protein
LPLSGLAGSNPASCREKNTLTPELYINNNAAFLKILFTPIYPDI